MILFARLVLWNFLTFLEKWNDLWFCVKYFWSDLPNSESNSLAEQPRSFKRPIPWLGSWKGGCSYPEPQIWHAVWNATFPRNIRFVRCWISVCSVENDHKIITVNSVAFFKRGKCTNYRICEEHDAVRLPLFAITRLLPIWFNESVIHPSWISLIFSSPSSIQAAASAHPTEII